MVRTALLRISLGILVLAGGVACSSEQSDTRPQEGEHEEAPELARYMFDLQRWTHKATLAIRARNSELADFYLHELEESIEAIQKEAPTYEGEPVGKLTNTMLAPAVDSLATALDQTAWPTVDRRLENVARACNQCHQTTGYGFIEVSVEDVSNPYPQRFAPTQ